MLGLECGGWLSRNVMRLLLGGEMVQVSIFFSKGGRLLSFLLGGLGVFSGSVFGAVANLWPF